MAGKVCPNCKQQTFFEQNYGRECSKCGFTMRLRPHNGTGGRGTKCPNCSEYKVRDEKCNGCGATFHLPK